MKIDFPGSSDVSFHMISIFSISSGASADRHAEHLVISCEKFSLLNTESFRSEEVKIKSGLPGRY